MIMKLLDAQVEDIPAIIITTDEVMGALFDEKGEQIGPVFFGSSHAELKKRAKKYFIQAGGHNTWQNGLELRIKI